MSAPLLDEVVLSDANLSAQKANLNSKASKLYMAWVSPEMLLHAVASTALAVAVYLTMSPGLGSSTAGASAHLLVGLVLGGLLIVRVVVGIYRVHEAAMLVQDFAKSCRTIAVLSAFVSETLTISAAAEIEKSAITRFRFELSRLLNLAFSHYNQTLMGMKVIMPATPLRASEDKTESELLAASHSPTVMVCKLLAGLFEQQRAAKRITAEQTALVGSKISDMVATYHSTRAVLLAPSPVSLSSFTFFFTSAWAYTAGPAMALKLLETAPSTGVLPLAVYTFSLSLFFFGLYQAGEIVEEPLVYVTELINTKDTAHTLSDDLASIIGGDVPVFLPPPKETDAN